MKALSSWFPLLNSFCISQSTGFLTLNFFKSVCVLFSFVVAWYGHAKIDWWSVKQPTPHVACVLHMSAKFTLRVLNVGVAESSTNDRAF